MALERDHAAERLARIEMLVAETRRPAKAPTLPHRPDEIRQLCTRIDRVLAESRLPPGVAGVTRDATLWR
ncbi:MAG TPA: hypothetical protein VNZ26_24390 [Vicinamibacterales bacterium]|jgi:hypothetical protein|nr:hypothetical protein [Vicinamibacterales bacterium]